MVVEVTVSGRMRGASVPASAGRGVEIVNCRIVPRGKSIGVDGAEVSVNVMGNPAATFPVSGEIVPSFTSVPISALPRSTIAKVAVNGSGKPRCSRISLQIAWHAAMVDSPRVAILDVS